MRHRQRVEATVAGQKRGFRSHSEHADDQRKRPGREKEKRERGRTRETHG